MDEDDSNGYVNISNDNSDVMWMKMALMAARRAAVPKYAEGSLLLHSDKGYSLLPAVIASSNSGRKIVRVVTAVKLVSTEKRAERKKVPTS